MSVPVRVPAAAILPLFTLFSMKGHELQIFEMLMKKPMTIKQLQQASHMSERIIRTYLDDLTERKLISKQVIEDRRLKYAYYANPPEMILATAQGIITSMEKARKRMEKDIVRGTEQHTTWRR